MKERLSVILGLILMGAFTIFWIRHGVTDEPSPLSPMPSTVVNLYKHVQGANWEQLGNVANGAFYYNVNSVRQSDNNASVFGAAVKFVGNDKMASYKLVVINCATNEIASQTITPKDVDKNEYKLLNDRSSVMTIEKDSIGELLKNDLCSSGK